jgi:uncharacterized membrane protein
VKREGNLPYEDLQGTGQRVRFPWTAGILLGLGLGALFEVLVLQDALQWHRMLSNAVLSRDSSNLQVHRLADLSMYGLAGVFVLAGLLHAWWVGRRAQTSWSWWDTRLVLGSMLLGAGAFALIEGTLDHHVLALHHVNETVPRALWFDWDIGFLMAAVGVMFAGLLVTWQRQPSMPDARRPVQTQRSA